MLANARPDSMLSHSAYGFGAQLVIIGRGIEILHLFMVDGEKSYHFRAHAPVANYLESINLKYDRGLGTGPALANGAFESIHV